MCHYSTVAQYYGQYYGCDNPGCKIPQGVKHRLHAGHMSTRYVTELYYKETFLGD